MFTTTMVLAVLLPTLLAQVTPNETMSAPLVRPSEAPAGTLIYIPANEIHTVVAVPDKGDVLFFTCKDMSHGIWGNPVDTSISEPRFAPGFEKK